MPRMALMPKPSQKAKPIEHPDKLSIRLTVEIIVNRLPPLFNRSGYGSGNALLLLLLLLLIVPFLFYRLHLNVGENAFGNK